VVAGVRFWSTVYLPFPFSSKANSSDASAFQVQVGLCALRCELKQSVLLIAEEMLRIVLHALSLLSLIDHERSLQF